MELRCRLYGRVCEKQAALLLLLKEVLSCLGAPSQYSRWPL